MKSNVVAKKIREAKRPPRKKISESFSYSVSIYPSASQSPKKIRRFFLYVPTINTMANDTPAAMNGICRSRTLENTYGTRVFVCMFSGTPERLL